MALLMLFGLPSAMAASRTNEHTVTIQTQLTRLGYAPGPIDGIYGPLTRAAVLRFQATYDLPLHGNFDRLTAWKMAETRSTLGASAYRTTSADVETYFSDERAIEELCAAAMSSDTEVRLDAVEALGQMNSARSRAVLGIILDGNARDPVRAAAARELGRRGDGRSMYTLALALDSEQEPSVRDAIRWEIENNLGAMPAPRVQTGAVATRP